MLGIYGSKPTKHEGGARGRGVVYVEILVFYAQLALGASPSLAPALVSGELPINELCTAQVADSKQVVTNNRVNDHSTVYTNHSYARETLSSPPCPVLKSGWIYDAGIKL